MSLQNKRSSDVGAEKRPRKRLLFYRHGKNVAPNDRSWCRTLKYLLEAISDSSVI